MVDFKKSCVYQIYPKSFKDTNGDGFGDINGITEKLDYLKELGVDYIWSTPFYISPQNDNGYDVADYISVDPRYGTMEDVERLIGEADKRGISIMLDMVFNHTSTEHEWFKKAMDGDEYYKDFYIFKDGKEDGSLPTQWVSKFGGDVWEYVPRYNQYYLHLYDKTQADLNWENPNVRKELKKVLEFWIDKGIRGFRFDVINLISKPEVYTDDFESDGKKCYTDGPKVHEYLKEISKDCGFYENSILTVGEMSFTTLDQCVGYSNPDERELSMCFNFHHLKVDYKNQDKWQLQPFDFQQLKDLFNKWQVGMERGNGWNAVFWCNHDQPRVISRFGDEGRYYRESAKMLAATTHLMRGTPYIFQGEEIGMTNAGFQDIGQYRDVESINYYNILKEKGIDEKEIYQILGARSRDNSRTPMQWDSSEYAGFSEQEPWISVNPNYREINAEKNREDEQSIFHFYKKLIGLRKEYDVISHGSYIPMLENDPNVLAYERRLEQNSVIVIANFYGTETEVRLEEKEMESYKCILSNYETKAPEQVMKVRPYEVVVLMN